MGVFFKFETFLFEEDFEVSDETQTLYPGHSRISHYKILQILGEGGWGAVYKAEDTKLHRKVAIKVLLPQYTSDKDMNARFEREAMAAASLNHPNIITVYGIDKYKDNSDKDILYIVMEYINGGQLNKWLAEKEISFDQAINIAIQICTGLSAAHKEGIIHRDVKPSNILIQGDSLPKISDFGIAKLKNLTPLTLTRPIFGTPYYASPEQYKGKEVDHRSDIYSAGVVLYELFAGFNGKYKPEVLQAISIGNPPPLKTFAPQIPGDIQKIVNKALAIDQEKRYQHIDDLSEALSYRKTSIKNKLLRLQLPSERKFGLTTALTTIIAIITIALVATVFILRDLLNISSSSKASLSISTQPDSAAVFLNNVSVGLSPLSDWPVDTGKISIRIEKSWYLPYETSHPIQPAQVAKLSFTLKEIGGLHVASEPSGAKVLLNKKSVGETPYHDFKVPVGSYNLALRKNDYEQYSKSIQVKHRRVDSFFVALTSTLQHRRIVECKPLLESVKKVHLKETNDASIKFPRNATIKQGLDIEAELALKSPSMAPGIIIFAQLRRLTVTSILTAASDDTLVYFCFNAVPNAKELTIPASEGDFAAGNYELLLGFFFLSELEAASIKSPSLYGKKFQLTISK